MSNSVHPVTVSKVLGTAARTLRERPGLAVAALAMFLVPLCVLAAVMIPQWMPTLFNVARHAELCVSVAGIIAVPVTIYLVARVLGRSATRHAILTAVVVGAISFGVMQVSAVVALLWSVATMLVVPAAIGEGLTTSAAFKRGYELVRAHLGMVLKIQATLIAIAIVALLAIGEISNAAWSTSTARFGAMEYRIPPTDWYWETYAYLAFHIAFSILGALTSAVAYRAASGTAPVPAAIPFAAIAQR